MNPEMTIDPVSCDGYTAHNLSGYYANTFLLYKPEDTYIPAFVENVSTDSDDDVFFCVNYLDDGGNILRVDVCGVRSIESQLFRMIIPNGWYLQSHKPPFCFKYAVSRSYKKGLCPDFMSAADVTGQGRRINLNLIKHMVYPRDHFSDSKWLISRRLAVFDGNVYTTYRNLTVGRWDGGELDTPFPCIRQRLEDKV